MTRLAIILLALTPLAARAESLQCDHAALARAEAAVLDAEARYPMATDAKARIRAAYMYTLAEAQLKAAVALCTETPPKDAPKPWPFVGYDPWQADERADEQAERWDDNSDAFDLREAATVLNVEATEEAVSEARERLGREALKRAQAEMEASIRPWLAR